MTEIGSVNQGSPPTSVTIQSEATYTPAIRGNYIALLTIMDAANNTAQSTITFETLDTTSPSLLSISISAIESENITINMTADKPANYIFTYDAGIGWNYLSDSSLRLNHTLALPKYSAGTNIRYYISLTDQYGNTGRYPSIGVNNFTVDGTLQFNQTALTLNLTEKQSRTIQIELRNPSSVPINATINKTKSWTTLQSSQYLNPLQTAIINITLTPDDISIGDWQATETITAHGSALTTFSITMNIAHAIGDGECDSGEACGTADCPACSSSSSGGGGGSSGGGGGGGTSGFPQVKHECENNTNCNNTQACRSYKCSDIKCGYCEYIKDHMCTKYECCKDEECRKEEFCKNNKCVIREEEEIKQNITSNIKDTTENITRAAKKETPKEETDRFFKSLFIIIMILFILLLIKIDLTHRSAAKYLSKDKYRLEVLEEYLDEIRPINAMHKANGRLDEKTEARLLEIEAEKDKLKLMLDNNNPAYKKQLKKTIDMLIALKDKIENRPTRE